MDGVKRALLTTGAGLIAGGEVPDDPGEQYLLLGAVGLYLAACARHGVGDPGVLAAPWAVAARIGAALGVAPRFVFAHQSTHNPARGGRFRTFTSLPDEHVFVTYNALGVLAYQRAAAALRRVPAMGVSSPFTTYLLTDALAALDDVLAGHRALAAKLDPDRFFRSVRPYFKSYRVGDTEYRGVNAGDFLAVNEIDLHLGLCSRDDPEYARVLAEKQPYLPPEDQRPLVTRNLLDDFLAEPVTAQLRQNGALFLAICRAHGAAAAFHHHRLVTPFLVARAGDTPAADVTASGPPLDVVVRGLARLVDLRAARSRSGTARPRLDLLRDRLDC